eukprot:UN10974
MLHRVLVYLNVKHSFSFFSFHNKIEKGKRKKNNKMTLLFDAFFVIQCSIFNKSTSVLSKLV